MCEWELGPDWVGYTVPAKKLQMISQIHHACLEIGNRPRCALCGFNKARARSVKSLQQKLKELKVPALKASSAESLQGDKRGFQS